MQVVFIVVKYPKLMGWAGFLSMALFRLPLWLNRSIRFWKLMGCGKNGSFDINPDWLQWVVLYTSVNDNAAPVPRFIQKWWKVFGCKQQYWLLNPIEGHGLWDGKAVFGNLPRNTPYMGNIAVLTRATIKLNKLTNFWSRVKPVATQMAKQEGFVTSIGIGEVPFIKQATFSVWQSKEAMKKFAYSMQEHKKVIVDTHKQAWYSEEMFVRFIIAKAPPEIKI
jgi:hypothetical protein